MTDLRQRIQHPSSLRLYDYWSARRRDRAYPARRDVDPAELRFALGNLMLIDVQREPLDFRIRLQGTLIARRVGWDLTGRFIGEIPDPELRERLRTSYTEVVATGQPSVACLERSFAGLWRRYEVVRLPLADDGRTIDMLLVGIMYFDPPPAALLAEPMPRVVARAVND
jgi:hypothetical protein